MGNLLETFKKVFGLDGEGNEAEKRPLWKKLNSMLVVAAAGILMIVLANTFGTGGNRSENPASSGPGAGQPPSAKAPGNPTDIVNLENNMARSLEDVLAQIIGVGEISVTVNLASTTEKDYAINTSTNNKKTTENDQRGGNRVITEVDEAGQMVLIRESQGSKEEPVVVKEIKPEVKGVIVVAEGADDPETKTDLMNAVSVYLDIPLYKVVVLSKESR